MQISSLEQQKKRKDRVSVFLDGEFWIGISERLCAELNLCAGMDVSNDTKLLIEEAAVEDGALQYAFDRLASGLMPEAELKKKLVAKGFSSDTINRTVERCRDLALLDDALWAETVSSDRKERGQGRRRVEVFLKQKGVQKDIINQTLDQVFLPEDEEEDALSLLENKFPQLLNPQEQRRAYSMLLRRGFSPNVSSVVVAKRSMDPEDAENAWGSEEALSLLRQRFNKDVSRDKAWNYLRRRSFSQGAIRRALEDFYS